MTPWTYWLYTAAGLFLVFIGGLSTNDTNRWLCFVVTPVGAWTVLFVRSWDAEEKKRAIFEALR